MIFGPERAVRIASHVSGMETCRFIIVKVNDRERTELQNGELQTEQVAIVIHNLMRLWIYMMETEIWFYTPRSTTTEALLR